MKVEITNREVLFHHRAGLVGRYVLNDPFKPHFAVLNTPSGHNIAVVSPADHRHHKGLMYALRCADLNFWEEDPGTGECGIQEILSTTAIQSGFKQEILWREEGGGLTTYRECRTISCQEAADKNAFEWEWHTRRESLRDHRLTKSPWSANLHDGRTVNYHGLGLRLPWAWSYPNDAVAGVEVNSLPISAIDVMGSIVPSVTMRGLMDGQWRPKRCAVTISQSGRNTWYALRQPFAYLAVGPSNAEELLVSTGDDFDETYHITVADR